MSLDKGFPHLLQFPALSLRSQYCTSSPGILLGVHLCGHQATGGRIRAVSLEVPAGAQLLQACPDLICSPVCCLPRSPYQHFTFHHDFPGLNVCVFNYVDPGEFPFQGLRSNISSCDFLLHNLSFSLLSLWGQFLNCHWCSQILSPSDFICIFH